MPIQFKVDMDGFERLKEGLKRAPEKTIDEAGNAINKSITLLQNESMKEAPINKQPGGGNLRQNIRTGMSNKLRGYVSSEAPYSIFVHEGTAPSPGRFVPGLGGGRTGKRGGRTGKRLVNGKNIGMHPGQKPNPYFTRALSNCKNTINNFFKEAIDNIFRSLQ